MPKGILACMLAAWLLAAARATAGTPPPAAGAAEDRETVPTAVQLDTVVVTARRRAESPQDVPQAITAIDGEELESRGADNLSALGAVTPNLTVYPARAFNGSLTAYIRGIGQFDPVWGVEPGVGIYVDDVHLARPQGALLDILDVQRVEVLRGPQGTLYGRNTMGGAIKYVSRDPTAEFEGRLTLTVGNYGRHDGKMILNVPLGENFRTRVAMAKYDRDGYGSNLVTGTDASARDAGVARISALWTPSAAVEVRLAYDRYRDRSGPPGARRLAVNPADPERTPPDPGRYDVRSGLPEKLDLDDEGASATVDWMPDARWRLRSISAWRHGDSDSVLDLDALPATIFHLYRVFENRQWSQEFQAHHDGDGSDFVAGLYLFDGDDAGAGGTEFRPAPPYLRQGGSVETRSAALYADWTGDLGASLQLEAGLRYTVERKSAEGLVQLFPDTSFTTPVATRSSFTGSKTYRAPTPKLALSWRASDAAMLYAQASRGFKGGSWNFRGSQHPLDAETVTAYELGAKTQWLDGKIGLNATVFRNEYDDIQLSVSVFDPVTQDFDVDFINAGSGTTQGAELEWHARLGAYLRWTGNIGYLDARYDEYVDAGVDVAATRRFPNAPRWTAGNSLVGDFPLHGGGALRARIDGRFQSEVHPTTFSDNLELLTQGAYALWNASLAWTSPDRRWEVTLRGDNLGDTAYRTTGFDYGPPWYILSAYYGPPRTYSLTLAYSF